MHNYRIDIDKSQSAYFKNTFQRYEVQDSEVNYLFINLKKSKAFNYTNNTINITDLMQKKGQNLTLLFLDQAQNLEKMIIIFL